MIKLKDLLLEGMPTSNSSSITDNPNFKRWFDGSKIVDSNGNPLMVYHGTSRKFKSFNAKKSVQGLFWFTSNKNKIEKGESGASGRSIIVPVYLSIKNPAGWDEYEKYMIGQLKGLGFDGIILDDDYVVFSPFQIKSAINNNGEFNPNNKSIYK